MRVFQAHMPAHGDAPPKGKVQERQVWQAAAQRRNRSACVSQQRNGAPHGGACHAGQAICSRNRGRRSPSVSQLATKPVR